MSYPQILLYIIMTALTVGIVAVISFPVMTFGGLAWLAITGKTKVLDEVEKD